jgi:hypothetical protein
MERGVQDQEKACLKDSLWVLCPLQAFSLPERVVSDQKASCGSGGTVLHTADAGLRARSFIEEM